MEFLRRLQSNPKFPAIIATLSYSLLTLCSAGGLLYYYTQIVNNEFNHWPLIAYLLMLANGLTGYTEFFDEDSFCPLRDLLDYCQVVLVLPCYAAELWTKSEMGPAEVAYVHAGLGFLAAAMFVVTEFRRQDLTDLAIFTNGFSTFGVGILSKNPLAFLAGLCFFLGYYWYKRSEDQCCLAPQDKFNFIMALFAIISVLSFDQNVVESIQSLIPEGLFASESESSPWSLNK
ncbi:uncharacterized protein LOC115883311 [Sitophilus oryzae]|uniref:Uncharacterized protein LOC115883311 n=1 Tax=Sitophilus oryzae TaxID=7048 RepID=A0A6J2Y1D9_SITOR|nr:uncharacterized protein LOC115883311 [Sitophilus oryzae]